MPKRQRARRKGRHARDDMTIVKAVTVVTTCPDRPRPLWCSFPFKGKVGMGMGIKSRDDRARNEKKGATIQSSLFI